MTNGAQRIATTTGAMLADPVVLGNAPGGDAGSPFDPKFWAARGELAAVSGGRGSAWFVGGASRPWVLRHFRRGGFMARLSTDRYLWCGESRVRAFAEWRLLDELARRGLPVPTPVAARYQRAGLTYRCDLITQRIADARSLSGLLESAPLPRARWRAIGTVIGRLHRAGVDHADLNAHNILLTARDTAPTTPLPAGAAPAPPAAAGGSPDDESGVHVIDFDRGRLRTPGAWSSRNLRRLKHSLEKLSASLPAGRFTQAAWSDVLAGYADARDAGARDAGDPGRRS